MISLYIQNSQFTVPTLTAAVASMPKTTFAEVGAGEYFLRTDKKGDGRVLLKIGKRNALLLLDSKGRCNKVLKFKGDAKVIPLDAKVDLQLASMTEAGKVEVARRASNLEHIGALKTERQVKPMREVLTRIANGLERGAFSAPVAGYQHVN